MTEPEAEEKRPIYVSQEQLMESQKAMKDYFSREIENIIKNNPGIKNDIYERLAKIDTVMEAQGNLNDIYNKWVGICRIAFGDRDNRGTVPKEFDAINTRIISLEKRTKRKPIKSALAYLAAVAASVAGSYGFIEMQYANERKALAKAIGELEKDTESLVRALEENSRRYEGRIAELEAVIREARKELAASGARCEKELDEMNVKIAEYQKTSESIVEVKKALEASLSKPDEKPKNREEELKVEDKPKRDAKWISKKWTEYKNLLERDSFDEARKVLEEILKVEEERKRKENNP